MTSKAAEAAVIGPVVVHPEDVQAGKAGTSPPSYEEVMGYFKTSVNNSEPELPPLVYIDIMPRCLSVGNMVGGTAPTFQNFSDILAGANLWLGSNPGLSVWKCETVERKVDKGPCIDLESMLQHESAYGFNVHVLGLRMWLTKKLDPSAPVQQLRMMNVVPEEYKVPVNLYSHWRYQSFFVPGVGKYPMGLGNFISYVGIKETLAKLNETLKNDPLPGSVLNVDSTTIKFAENFQTGPIDPEVTCWHEKGGSAAKRYTQILRIFYICGPPKQELIQMHEVEPDVLVMPEWNKPARFANFDNVLTKARLWLQCQQGIRLVNIETRKARVHSVQNSLKIDSDSTDQFYSAYMDARFVHVLRLFYVSAPEIGTYSGTVLTSRLFVPVRLTMKTFETMSQTMSRIVAWLQLTGLNIFGVETVPYLFVDNDGNGVNSDRADFKVNRQSGKYWVTTIRLYFSTSFQEPSPLLLPRTTDWMTQGGGRASGMCTIT
ncbi:uncharacterized protein LOC121384709 [Gigantopelta aegis]|uniref:uncharacterized protein LOC121384709 n=1 Tax=Gigantopelta aegis TaxID=1735272 RepID=UPI001B88CC88|nr:uncharacterized protein LOC121384709 [Gigantopelta aegis]